MSSSPFFLQGDEDAGVSKGTNFHKSLCRLSPLLQQYILSVIELRFDTDLKAKVSRHEEPPAGAMFWLG